MDPILERIREAAREIRARHVPDPRVDVFEVRIGPEGEAPRRVIGQTTVPAAADDFAERLVDLKVEADIRIAPLSDPSLAPRTEALVRAAIGPVYRRPTMNSTQLTQYTLGNRLTLLSRRGRFWRVRGEDGHIGWIHGGYLVRGELEWALGWERAESGEPVISLGAELHDDRDDVLTRLPWGARVVQLAQGRVLLPDGRTGRVASGEIVPVDRLTDRFPARGESIIRTARRWTGSPYLWGGITPAGVDCSGLVQSVFWIHGVALPRDSDMQSRMGAEVEPTVDFDDLRPGDLVFFSERGRVNHVALSVGGPVIIHAAASNGGVALDDLTGDRPLEELLRGTFRVARRLLPD